MIQKGTAHGLRIMLFVTVAVHSGCGVVRKPVMVQTDPPGAQVYVNGEYLGKSPCSFTVVDDNTPGVQDHYQIVARRPGYRESTKMLKDTPGSSWIPDRVLIRLEPISDGPAQGQSPAPIPPDEDSRDPSRRLVPGTGRRYAIAIGISEYSSFGQGVLGHLPFASKDAMDLTEVLIQTGWDRDRIRLLRDKEATKRNVEYALETWLRRAGPRDLILLYWSGHGWPDPEDPERAYFACYDSKPSDPSSGMRMDRVRQALEERGVRNVVVIADTCHSGKVIRSIDPRGVSIGPALESMRKRDQIPKGWIFIASAESDRKAYEDKAWNNGALTHVLLEGLRGDKADGYQSTGTRDGIVTMAELRAYISDRMREESLNIIGARLDPLFYTTSGDPGIWKLSLEAK